MKSLLVTLVLLGSINSFAQETEDSGPQIEPGPSIQLDESSNEAIDALLLAKSSDLSQFRKSGNIMQSVSRQNLAPGQTMFTFTRQHCSTGGIVGHLCLGGSTLVVNVEVVQQGSITKTNATSKLYFIK